MGLNRKGYFFTLLVVIVVPMFFAFIGGSEVEQKDPLWEMEMSQHAAGVAEERFLDVARARAQVEMARYERLHNVTFSDPETVLEECMMNGTIEGEYVNDLNYIKFQAIVNEIYYSNIPKKTNQPP